ncbi:MAG: hypothetical protein ACFFED_16445 [Candidatus Thorarchaeota archaeon]
MNHKNSSAIFISVILFLGPVFVSAQSTYGFSWGVSIGDQIHYSILIVLEGSDSPTRTFSEDVVLTIEDLADLTEYSSYAGFPPPAQANTTYVNGTQIGLDDPIFQYSFTIIVFPIGNWTHYRYLTEGMDISDDDSMVYEFSEDLSSWSLDFDISYSNDYRNTTYQFSKTDGALLSLLSYYYHEIAIENETLFTQTDTVEITRTNFGVLGPISTLSAIAIIVEIIIVVELFRRYKGRNALKG